MAQPKSVLYPINQSQNGVLVQFNPAYQNLNSNIEAIAFSKVYVGAFSNNNLSLFSFTSRLGSKKAKNYHNLGISAYFDKEGNYFNRNRIYGHYGYVVNLNKVWNASLGISLGMCNYKIGNSDYFDGGSDNAFDTNIGFVVNSDKTVLGISLMQITQRQLQPINEISNLRRYLNLIASHKNTLNKKTILNSFASASIYQDRLPLLVLSSSLVYQDLVSIGLITKPLKSAGLIFGLENIKIDKHSFKLLFSYETNLSNSYKNNSAELCLKYYLPKKKLPFRKANSSKGYKK